MNLSILLVLLFFVGRQIIKTMKPLVATNVDVSDILKGPQMAAPAGGGGGGGSHDIVDPMKGKLPPRMKDPITPPMVPSCMNQSWHLHRPSTFRRTSHFPTIRIYRISA